MARHYVDSGPNANIFAGLQRFQGRAKEAKASPCVGRQHPVNWQATTGREAVRMSCNEKGIASAAVPDPERDNCLFLGQSSLDHLCGMAQSDGSQCQICLCSRGRRHRMVEVRSILSQLYFDHSSPIGRPDLGPRVIAGPLHRQRGRLSPPEHQQAEFLLARPDVGGGRSKQVGEESASRGGVTLCTKRRRAAACSGSRRAMERSTT